MRLQGISFGALAAVCVFWVASAPAPSAADTVTLTAIPLPTTTEDTLTITVPNNLLPGTYEIRTFAVDGATPQRSGFGTPINISVLDGVAPGISILNPLVDSIVIAGDAISVIFRATDLTGVDSVQLKAESQRGDINLGTAVIVERYFPKTALIDKSLDTVLTRILAPVLTDSTPEQVTLTATVFDVGGNSVSISSTIQVVAGPRARIISPANGSTHPVGTPLVVNIDAFSPDSVTSVFVVASGVFTGTDTLAFTSPLSLTSVTPLSITVPNNADLGTVTVFGFATDNAGKLIPSDTITVTLTDTQAPTISFALPDSAFLVRTTDSVRVSVRVQDNKGVASVTMDGVAHRGFLNLGTNTVVQRFDVKQLTLNQLPDTTLLRDLLATAGDETAESVYVRVVATDSSGNTARDSVLIQVIEGPALTITLPADSAVVAPGKDISITIRGQADTGIKKIGFTTSGVFATADTNTVLPTTNPQVKDTTLTFTLTVPDTTSLGFITVNPFGRDSLGKVGTGDDITIQVVANAGASDTLPPLVTDSLDLRVESDDTISVRANDPGGISQIGFFVIRVGTTDTLSRGSAAFPGTSTDVVQLFELGLDTVTTFPLEVYVTAFALDSVGNRGVLSQTSVALSVADGETADTVILVAGRTFALPQGGTVADAIYSRNRNEVYFTNIDLDQVEIFDIATNSFKTPVAVGSRPWGIALWPRDTLGTHADTIVVANSGGTNMSIVDMSLSPPVETRRHALPNFIIHRVRTDPTEGTGGDRLALIIEEHDFSDRPQFLGMVCRVTTGSTLCAQDSIIAVYSTTPTIDQGATFASRGTIRWENLTACKAADPVSTGEFCDDVVATEGLVAATGTLTLNPNAGPGEDVTIDNKTYTFRDPATFTNIDRNCLMCPD
ncbi:MAG: hypothetical protein IIA27_15570, partial [Gemmatimonadetes bacterium]|nr:hypothetical protein [Gemmatimonadota bacterium]